MRSTRRTLIVLATVASVALAACGGDGEDPAAEDTVETDPTPAETARPGDDATGGATDTETAPDQQMTTVAAAASDLGDIVVDGEGVTLYAFLPDDQSAPTCTGDCAATWPPLEGPAEAGEGLDEGLLGTVEHPAGVTQVTYDGWPLYYFANDQQPGDTNGQSVGDNWYVVGPDGQPIQDAAAGRAPGY